MKLSKFWIHSLILLCLLLTGFSERAYAFDSMIAYENQMSDGKGVDYTNTNKDCISQNKTYQDMGDYDNTYIPGTISPDSISQMNSSTGAGVIGGIVGRSLLYTGAMFIPFVGPIIALFGLMVDGVVMQDICNNVYIMQPHEWLNIQKGYKTCTYNAVTGTWENASPKALTQDEVPHFFTCDPTYDISTGTNIMPGSSNDSMIGKMWGYLGATSNQCNNISITTEDIGWLQPHIGQLPVIDTGNITHHTFNTRTRCNPLADSPPGGGLFWIDTKKDIYIRSNTIKLHAYYKYDAVEGRVQMCVVAPDLLMPTRVGCGLVAPPNDDPGLDADLLNYIKGTRCEYFLYGRKDLKALGQSLTDPDPSGQNGYPVKAFLQSDLHFTSTVVGCIKDMLLKVFISPTGMGVNPQDKPFFGRVQDNLRQIVFTVLVLYVTLLGIKIMSIAQQPSRGEYAMYILKFALVVYFTTAGAWYTVQGNDVKGLLPAIMGAAEEFGDIFLNAQNDNDPVGFCKYQYGGKQLLGQRDIPASLVGGVGTAGLSVVRVTIWDLIDCKIVNYLNLGSCTYSLAGLMAVWFVGAAFFSGGSGFLLCLVSFIYTLMLMFIIFRFAHIYVMSLFVLAVLTLISPIILCFALFEATKQIFQTWLRMIFGYMLYPALLMAFVALMLATFDAAFYGTILKDGDSITINKDPCQDTTNAIPVACVTAKNLMDKLGSTPCSISATKLANQMIEVYDIGIMKLKVMKGEYIQLYLTALLKLMLFAVLFYFFLGSVAQFLEILVGIQGLSGMALGGFSMFTPAATVGSAVSWVGGKAKEAQESSKKSRKEQQAKKASKNLDGD